MVIVYVICFTIFFILLVSSFQLNFNFFNYQPWQRILSVTMCCVVMTSVFSWYFPMEWNADWFLCVYVELCVCVFVCISFTDANIATLDLMLWYDYMWTCISFPIGTLFCYNEGAFWHNCFVFSPNYNYVNCVPSVCLEGALPDGVLSFLLLPNVCSPKRQHFMCTVPVHALYYIWVALTPTVRSVPL